MNNADALTFLIMKLQLLRIHCFQVCTLPYYTGFKNTFAELRPAYYDLYYYHFFLRHSKSIMLANSATGYISSSQTELIGYT